MGKFTDKYLCVQIEERNNEIDTLKAANERLNAERDAAVKDLVNYHNPCGSCVHRTKYNHEYPCYKCQHVEQNRQRAGFVSYFKWRGTED